MEMGTVVIIKPYFYQHPGLQGPSQANEMPTDCPARLAALFHRQFRQAGEFLRDEVLENSVQLVNQDWHRKALALSWRGAKGLVAPGCCSFLSLGWCEL